MSFSSVIDLCVTFVQYFSGIIEGRSDFSIPDSWGSARQVTEVFSIGITFIQSVIPSLTDFRLYFAAVGVVTPLFFVFLGLGFLNPLRVLLWYILTLAAILLTIVGGLGKILFANVSFLNNIQIEESLLLIFVIVGPVLLAICIWMFTKRETLLQIGAEPASEANTLEQRMDEETQSIAPATLLLRFILSGALIFFGLVFIGVVGGTPFDVNQGTFAAFAIGFGYFFLSLGGIFFIYMCIGLFQAGRKLQWKAAAFFEEHFLRLFLIVFSILYIPIVSPVFLVFNCNPFSCDAGFRLKDTGSIAPFNVTLQNGLCQACSVYPGQLCPVMLQTSICSPVIEDRLESDLSLPCDKVKALFWPAAGAMILCTVLGVPLIFYDLISRSVEIIEHEFPIRDITDEEKQKQIEEKKKSKLEARLDAEEGIIAPTQQQTNNNNNNNNKYATAAETSLSSPSKKQQTVSHLEEARGGGETPPAPQSPTVERLQQQQQQQDGALIVTIGDQQQQQNGEEDDKITEFDPNDPHLKWRLKVVATRNVAKFLYQPFLPTMRYTRLFFLIQKFVSVFLSTFIIRIGSAHPTWIQLGSNIVIHLIGLGAVAGFLPFMYTFENVIAILMELILVITSTLSILIFADVEMPDWVLIFILICNGVLPVCALVIAIVLEWTSEQSAEEADERKKQEELKKEIENKKKALQEKKKAKADAALAKKINSLEESELAARTAIIQEEDGSNDVLVSTMTIAEAEIALNAEKVAEEEKDRRREQLEQEKLRLIELEKKKKDQEEAETKRKEEEAAKKLKEEQEEQEAAALLKAKKRSASRHGDDNDDEDDDPDNDDNNQNKENKEGRDGKSSKDGQDDDDDDDDEISPEDLQELLDATVDAGDTEKAAKLKAEIAALNGKIGNLEVLAEKQEQDFAEQQQSVAYFGTSKSKGPRHQQNLPPLTKQTAGSSDKYTDKKSEVGGGGAAGDLTSESSLKRNRKKSVTIFDGEIPVEVLSKDATSAEERHHHHNQRKRNDEDEEEMRQIRSGEFSPAQRDDENDNNNNNLNKSSADDVFSPPPVLPHGIQDNNGGDGDAPNFISDTSPSLVLSPSAVPPTTFLPSKLTSAKSKKTTVGAVDSSAQATPTGKLQLPPLDSALVTPTGKLLLPSLDNSNLAVSSSPKNSTQPPVTTTTLKSPSPEGSGTTQPQSSSTSVSSLNRRRPSLSRQDLIEKQKKMRLRVNMTKFRALARMVGKKAVARKKAILNNDSSSPLAGNKKLVGDDIDLEYSPSLMGMSPGDDGSGIYVDESDALFLDEEENGVDYEKDLPADFDQLPLEQQLSLRREISRKKRAKKERRHDKLRQLEEILDKKRKKAAERLLICQENVDYKINLLVKTRLNGFLMVMGMTGLVALALCAIALLSEDSSLVSSSFGSNLARTPAREFVGYGNWADFTASCCCTAGINLNATSNNIIEKWICQNGQIREHLRASKLYYPTNDTIVDGFLIRDLCAVSLSNGCTVGTAMSSSGETVVQISCPSGVDVTSYQLQHLW